MTGNENVMTSKYTHSLQGATLCSVEGNKRSKQNENYLIPLNSTPFIENRKQMQDSDQKTRDFFFTDIHYEAHTRANTLAHPNIYYKKSNIMKTARKQTSAS